MRYINAQGILPEDVLAIVQKYLDGAYLYIPRKPTNRKNWGDSTQTKQEIKTRNERIYAEYKAGKKAATLADEYYLSDKSIQRIITLGRKNEQK